MDDEETSRAAASTDATAAAEAAEALVDLLVQTSFDIVAIVTRIGAEHNLSLTQARMLGILRDRTLTMAQLADHLGLERSTISGLVDRAETRGLVVRTASAADRRSTQLSLTPDGQTLARDAVAKITRTVLPIVESMPDAARQSLPMLLAAMHEDTFR
jgi:DNA-binding MarR family transcriptional regulator